MRSSSTGPEAYLVPRTASNDRSVPASTRASKSGGLRVVILITPARASAPQTTEFGPRRSSTLPTVPASIPPKSNPPAGAAASATRTPSISTNSWSAEPPRTDSPVKPPSPPLRLKVALGSRSRMRVKLGPWIRSISEAVMMLTGCARRAISSRSAVARTVICDSCGGISSLKLSPSPAATVSGIERTIVNIKYRRTIPPIMNELVIHGGRARGTISVHPLALACGAPRPRAERRVAGRSPGSPDRRRIARLPGRFSPVACERAAPRSQLRGQRGIFTRFPS